MKKILAYCWEQDPGWFRFKYSAKTILSILLTVMLLQKLETQQIVLAALAVTFSTMEVLGCTRREQAHFLFCNNSIYFINFELASGLNQWPLLASTFLIICAFLVFWLKKYNAKLINAPVFWWVFAYLGTIFPHYTGLVRLETAGGMILGLTIAAVIHLWVLPEDKKKLFYNNLKQFFSDYAQNMQWLLLHLLVAQDQNEFKKTTSQQRAHIAKLTEISNNIISSLPATDADQESMRSVYFRQHALHKLLGMIVEGFQSMKDTALVLSIDAESQLFTALATYAAIIGNLANALGSQNGSFITYLMVLQKELQVFNKQLQLTIKNNAANMMPLLNINLSLSLIYQNLSMLEESYAH